MLSSLGCSAVDTAAACDTDGTDTLDDEACCDAVDTIDGTYGSADDLAICLPFFGLRICTCDNGVAATGTDCVEDGSNTCVGCDAGFTLDTGISVCVANVCLCDNGVVAVGSDCLDNGSITCTSCDPGYSLDDSDECLPVSLPALSCTF